MYTFTNKLRNFSIILMVVGFLGLTHGFLTSPDTVEEAQAMVADVHHDGHGADHGEAHDAHADDHGAASHADIAHDDHHEAASSHGEEPLQAVMR